MRRMETHHIGYVRRRFWLPIAKNIVLCTLVLVGACPDRAEGTIRGSHPWTRLERVKN